MNYSGWNNEDNITYTNLLNQLEDEKYDLDENINKEIDILDNKLDINKSIINFKPTELRVSTITAICNINVSYINLERINEHICNKCRFLLEKKSNLHKCIRSKKRKSFYNQATMLIGISNNKRINLKIFLNGTIHLTGLKREEEGIEAVNTLINKIKKIDNNKIKVKLPVLIKQCQRKKINNKDFSYLMKLYKSFKNILPINNISELVINNLYKKTQQLRKLAKGKKISSKELIIEDNDYNIYCKIYKYIKDNKLNSKIVNNIHNFHKVLLVYNRERENLELKNFKICLINSDFSVGFKIKRHILYQYLTNIYKIEGMYEPDYYPGVNSKFYWNKLNKNTTNFGVCTCTKSCDGKGNGEGNGKCKRVTIAIFQSGKIIITGARNLMQINDAYHFINNVLDKHYDDLKKGIFNLEKTDDIINNKFDTIIYKNKIKNFEVHKQLKSLSSKDLVNLLSSSPTSNIKK